MLSVSCFFFLIFDRTWRSFFFQRLATLIVLIASILSAGKATTKKET